MPLIRVNSAFVGSGNSITLPAHQAGDLIIIYAARLGTGSQVFLPAGWSSIDSLQSTNYSNYAGYIYATSSSMTSGTWTNANRLMALVYRGAAYQQAATALFANSATIQYPALTMSYPSVSWLLRMAGHVSATNLQTNIPSGFSVAGGSTSAIVGFDTNGSSASVVATNQSVNASAFWSANTIELYSAPYMSTLSDDFSNSTTSNNLFNITGGAAVASGVVTIPTSAFVYPKLRYDIYDGSVVFDITQMPSHDVVGNYHIYVSGSYDINSSSSTEFYSIVTRVGSNLTARVYTTNVTYVDSTLTYNATTMRYIRFRHNGTTNKFYIDYSPDAVFWNNLSETTLSAIQSASLRVGEFYLYNGGTNGSPTDFIVSSVNVVPASNASSAMLLFF